jgi:hypothetical protein
MTMLTLCLLAFTVAIATLATRLVVQIMWNKIEGRTMAKGQTNSAALGSKLNTQGHDTVQIRPLPSLVADPGKVRIGGESLSFGPVHAPMRGSTR